jgi:hypothetical protein
MIESEKKFENYKEEGKRKMGEKEEKEKLTEADRCRIAWEISIDEAMSECGWTSKEGKEEAFKAIGTMLGLEEKEANDLSEKGEEILKRGLSKDICYDFREIRRWVLINCWRLMEEQKIPFREAVKASWAEAKKRCAELGAYI